MSFHCPTCRRMFSLTWKPGEQPESYSFRLQRTEQTTCPNCGTAAKRVRCKAKETQWR